MHLVQNTSETSYTLASQDTATLGQNTFLYEETRLMTYAFLVQVGPHNYPNMGVVIWESALKSHHLWTNVGNNGQFYGNINSAKWYYFYEAGVVLTQLVVSVNQCPRFQSVVNYQQPSTTCGFTVTCARQSGEVGLECKRQTRFDYAHGRGWTLVEYSWLKHYLKLGVFYLSRNSHVQRMRRRRKGAIEMN